MNTSDDEVLELGIHINVVAYRVHNRKYTIIETEYGGKIIHCSAEEWLRKEYALLPGYNEKKKMGKG